MVTRKVNGEKEQHDAEEAGHVKRPQHAKESHADHAPGPEVPVHAEPEPEPKHVDVPAKAEPPEKYESIPQKEVLAIYHAARVVKENSVNNAAVVGSMTTILEIVKRGLVGFKECKDFDETTKKCANPTCEDGLHDA